jgi:DNA invertase Pin-like site-specific DNA recombinase
MGKHTAIYARVSTGQQSLRSQLPDLQRWISAQGAELGEVRWYTDQATGKNMNRPGWQKLHRAIEASQVDKVVVWRLDRLGRSAGALCHLFDQLNQCRVRLISLKEMIDLASPQGRLVADIMAAVAAFETELRGERVRAGQNAARAAGKRWGGSPRGRRLTVTPEQEKLILTLHAQGQGATAISRATGVSRRHVYTLLEQARANSSAA